MIRKTMKTLLIALVAVFALGSMAEASAAPKRTVHKRAKHSTRVSAGSTVSTRKTTTVKRKNGTVTKTTTKKSTVKKPTTKPR